MNSPQVSTSPTTVVQEPGEKNEDVEHLLAVWEKTIDVQMRFALELYCMLVQYASSRRERGACRGAYGPRDRGTGDLHLTYRTTNNRRVAVLQLLGADRRWPNLYDPRLVDLTANRLRFIGYEPADKAWYMQEWICELVPSGP